VAEKKPSKPLRFDDVINCRTVAELIEFTDNILEQQRVTNPEERRRVAWALFHRWKSGLKRR